MKALYGAEQVERALVNVEKRIDEALRKINRQAGRLLANGDYPGMEALVQLARSVQGYRTEYCEIRRKWKEIVRQGKTKNGPKEQTTPLWSYYQPLLNVLIGLGGEASRRDIEIAFEKRLHEFIKDGDMNKMPNGSPRWKVMIGRAHKPMIKEGFLDASKMKRWVITSIGRQAAQSKSVIQQDKRT